MGTALAAVAAKIISSAKVYDASSAEKEIPAAQAVPIGRRKPQKMINHKSVRRIVMDLMD